MFRDETKNEVPLYHNRANVKHETGPAIAYDCAVHPLAL